MNGRILIVDPLATNRIVLRTRLAAAFYDVAQAASGAEALALLATRSGPELVICADWLADMPGHDLIRRLRDRPGLGDLPAIVIQSADDSAARMTALRAGADEVMARPIDSLLLMARLRSLLRARRCDSEPPLREDARKALGLAEDSPAFARPGRVALVPAGAEPDLSTLCRGLQIILPGPVALCAPDTVLRPRAEPPDVYVIAETPTAPGKGLALLSDLRARPSSRDAGMLFLAAPQQRQSAATALDLGACDAMIGPVDVAELALRLERLIARQNASRRLRATVQHGVRAALTDPLTGVFNRRYALPKLERMIDTAARRDAPCAVMLADLDHFKRINDRFGHAAGDAVLVEVARRLSAELRPADLLARHGGEEFLIALPDTGRGEALRIARRLCNAIAGAPFALPGKAGSVGVTISIGVAIGGRGTASTPLLDSADRALYGAKADGRNQALIGTASAA